MNTFNFSGPEKHHLSHIHPRLPFFHACGLASPILSPCLPGPISPTLLWDAAPRSTTSHDVSLASSHHWTIPCGLRTSSLPIPSFLFSLHFICSVFRICHSWPIPFTAVLPPCPLDFLLLWPVSLHLSLFLLVFFLYFLHPHEEMLSAVLFFSFYSLPMLLHLYLQSITL